MEALQESEFIAQTAQIYDNSWLASFISYVRAVNAADITADGIGVSCLCFAVTRYVCLVLPFHLPLALLADAALCSRPCQVLRVLPSLGDVYGVHVLHQLELRQPHDRRPRAVHVFQRRD